MHPDLWTAVAAERHKDLLIAADRRRLAAAAAPSEALRHRLGRHLVGLGVRIAGGKELVRNQTHQLARREEG